MRSTALLGFALHVGAAALCVSSTPAAAQSFGGQGGGAMGGTGGGFGAAGGNGTGTADGGGGGGGAGAPGGASSLGAAGGAAGTNGTSGTPGGSMGVTPNAGGGGGGGGGDGILFPSGGLLAITQNVTAGDGGNGGATQGLGSGGGGSGGYGIAATGPAVFVTIDTASVTAGRGGNGAQSSDGTLNGSGGDGGVGTYFRSAGSSITVNSGSVGGSQGGAGGGGFSSGPGALGGNGGIGVLGTVFSVANAGFIFGGNGGVGGDGVNAAGARGGTGGAGVVGTLVTITNTNSINGGSGGTGASALNGAAGAGGTGGAGVIGTVLTITNDGTIAGGLGGQSQAGAGAAGGAGGAGGSGGIGVISLGPGSLIANNGLITGSAGGQGGSGVNGAGGAGGTGGAAVVGTGLTVNNTSTITGGVGGRGGSNLGFPPSITGAGGAGGAGISGNGLAITNTGAITGGDGNFAGSTIGGGLPGAIGQGGIGINGSNLLVANAGGTISGGFSAGAVAQNFAVQITGGTNYVGTGGTITGGINVLGGSFQPALPGSAVGTPLAVTGPLAFAQGSIYGVRLTPVANDRVNATGTATPGGGTVSVTAGGGPIAPGTTYTIITATGGVNGTFSGVTSNLAFFTPTLSYDATDVFLTAAYNYLLPGATQNQRAVGAGLNNAARLNGGGGALLAGLDQVAAGQGGAILDSLSGEGIAATQNVAHRSAQLFTSSIFDQTTFYGSDRGGANQIVLTAPAPGRPASFQALAPQDTLKAASLGRPIRELADLPAPRPQFIEVAPVASTRTWRAWGTGFGASEDVRSNQAIGFAAQQNSIVGGSVGVDYQLSPGTLVGVAAGGTDGSFNVLNRATSGSTTGGHVAGYTLASFGPFHGAASLSGSFFTNKTTRSVAGFGGLAGETERGSFNSREVRARLEAGRGFAVPSAFGALTVTPFAALEIAQLRSDGFAEQTIAGGPGGPGLFALAVSGQSAADIPAFAGLRFTSVTALGNGIVLKPVFQAAYVHNFAPERQVFAGLNSLPGAVFLVDGARPARDAAQVKAGGELLIGARTSIFANFDGEFARASQLYGGKGGIKFLF